MKIPATIPEGGFDPLSRRKINELIRALESLQILRTPDFQIDRTARGTFLRSTGSGAGDNTNSNTAPRWG